MDPDGSVSTHAGYVYEGRVDLRREKEKVSARCDVDERRITIHSSGVERRVESSAEAYRESLRTSIVRQFILP